MLSQSVDYALRAMVYLADLHPQPQTNRQIAKRTKVPPAYLSKLMQSLARARLVRGRNVACTAGSRWRKILPRSRSWKSLTPLIPSSG